MAEDLPTEYDVIVVGTGMTESILAAASARIGKKVLHLDRRDYYSAQWSVFNWEAMQKWIEQQSEPVSLNGDGCSGEEFLQGNERLLCFGPTGPDAYNVEQEWFLPEPEPEPAEPFLPPSSDTTPTPTPTERAPSPSETFNTQPESLETPPETPETIAPPLPTLTPPPPIGPPALTRSHISEQWRRFNFDLSPKLLFSRGTLVDLLISSNIARYAEFKSVTRVLSWLDGRLEAVPCSRSDVFATRNISVVEKRMLMKLLELVSEYEAHPEDWEAFQSRTFLDFLKSRRLTSNIIHYVLHAISMTTEHTPCVQGLESCRRFLKSLGRYGNTPFLWPLYGSGELPQCFCRMCAVYGGIYHLKRGVASAILNQDGHCQAVVSAGQRMGCKFLVMEDAQGRSQAVSRAIFLTDRSLMDADREQLTLLRFPGDSEREPITIIEVGSSSMATPSGLFLVHMVTSQRESDAKEDLLHVATELLNFAEQSDQSSKPRVLWALYFNLRGRQEDPELPPNVFRCNGPGLELDFEDSVAQAKQIWQNMYPEEEFLPRAPDPEEIIMEGEENPGPDGENPGHGNANPGEDHENPQQLNTNPGPENENQGPEVNQEQGDA